MSRAKAVKTVDDFIAEVNRCKAGRYYLGDDVSGNPNEPLSACICFDSARWEFYPETRTKALVLHSQTEGKENGCVRVRAVQGIEHIRGNERGNAYAIIAGDGEGKRYVFCLNNTTV